MQQGGEYDCFGVEVLGMCEWGEFLLEDKGEGGAAEDVVQGAFGGVLLDVLVGGGGERGGGDGDLANGEGWEGGGHDAGMLFRNPDAVEMA